MNTTRCPRGFSVIELLTVIVVMSILAAVVLTGSTSSYHEQLHAAARVVAAELNHTRSLAETNDSEYTAVFDLDANRLTIKHSGSNASLDQLARSVFESKNDTDTQHVLDLDEMDCVDGVKIYKIAVFKNSLETTNRIEFGPLGETSVRYPTLIWLEGGPADGRLYLLISVDPATGLASIGKHAGSSPIPLIAAHEALRDVDGSAPTLPTN